MDEYYNQDPAGTDPVSPEGNGQAPENGHPQGGNSFGPAQEQEPYHSPYDAYRFQTPPDFSVRETRPGTGTGSSGPSGNGDGKSPADGVRKKLDILYDKPMLRDGHRDPGDIHLLKGILPQKGEIHIAGDCHNGHGIHVGCGNARDKIGGAGAAGGKADPHLSAGPGIAVRRMGSSLFMRGQHMADLLLMAVQLVIDI